MWQIGGGRSKMAAEEEAVVFENLPNFRQAGGRGLTNKRGQRVRDGLLYRSSRTDFITPKDKSLFLQLGIKSIIDLRRQSEYERSDGSKLLDDIYPVWILKKGQAHPMKPSFRWGGRTKSSSPPPSDEPAGRRYLVNMWTMKIIWHIFTQANFFIRWLSIVLVLIDWLTGLHLFVKFFTWLVLNRHTVPDQYIDVVELAKPVIVDVVRFMCREGSLPMLIHCAHGKDRTGILVAVVLGLLDVDNEEIVRDYADSQDGLVCIKERVYQEIVERYGFKLECTYAERNTMEQVLEHIETNYGSVSEYLLSGGFTLKEQEHFKNIFLEPETET